MDVVGRRARAAAAAADRAPEPGARRRPSLPRAARARPDRRDDRLGRRRELRAARHPARRRLPRAARRGGLRAAAGRTSSTSTTTTEIAYFAVESREESLDRRRCASTSRPATPRRSGRARTARSSAAWTPDHSRVVLVDGYTMGDIVLYEIDDAGERRMLYGTPIEEREPDGGVPAVRASAPRYGTASGAGVLLATTLYDDTGSLAFLDLARPGEVEPVAIDGLAHDGVGELERLEHLEGDRYSLTLQHRRLLVGLRGSVRRGGAVVHGRARARRARASSRAASCTGSHSTRRAAASSLSFCTATSPTQLYVLPADDAPPATLTRERALGLAPELLSAGRGRVVRVARRPARLRAALPAVARARLRGAAAARLLRPRRAAEPGAPELRVVLDAAHPDPHARGLRGLRPERARLDRLRARLLEARRPRLGRPRPARPRARDDRGAAARRASRRLAGRRRRPLVRRLHDAHARGAASRSSGAARSTCSARTTCSRSWIGCPRRGSRTSRSRSAIPEKDRDFLDRALAEDAHRRHLVPAARHPGPERSARRRARVARRRRAAARARTDVDYLVFEDEGHDVLKLPNRVRCYDTIVEFFAQHLS